ncbi:hypothetical protein, partial [Bradyrhizobium yuanmingense]
GAIARPNLRTNPKFSELRVEVVADLYQADRINIAHFRETKILRRIATSTDHFHGRWRRSRSSPYPFGGIDYRKKYAEGLCPEESRIHRPTELRWIERAIGPRR